MSVCPYCKNQLIPGATGCSCGARYGYGNGATKQETLSGMFGGLILLGIGVFMFFIPLEIKSQGTVGTLALFGGFIIAFGGLVFFLSRVIILMMGPKWRR